MSKDRIEKSVKYLKNVKTQAERLDALEASVIKKLQIELETANKRKAELLAALKHIRGNLYHIKNKCITDDFRIELKAIAQKAITKHKEE